MMSAHQLANQQSHPSSSDAKPLQPLQPKLKWKAIYIAAISITLLAMALSLTVPLGVDQQAFLYATQQLQAGARPGIELWELKPPIHLYLCSAASWLTGGLNEMTLPVLDVVAQSIGALVLAMGLNQRFGKPAGTFAAWFYLWHYFVVLPFDDRGQVEGLANGFLMIAVGALCLNRIWLWAMGGAAFAIASLFKGVGLAFALPLYVLWRLKLENRSLCAKVMVMSALLTLAGWLMTWSMQGSLMGVWQDLRDAQQFQSSLWSDVLFLPSTALLYATARLGWLWVILFAAVAATDKVRARSAIGASDLRQLLWCMLLWLAVALGIAALQRKFFPYHFLPTLPAVAISCGVVVAWAWHFPHPKAAQKAGLAAVLAIAGLGVTLGALGHVQTRMAVWSATDLCVRRALLADFSRQLLWSFQAGIGQMDQLTYHKKIYAQLTDWSDQSAPQPQGRAARFEAVHQLGDFIQSQCQPHDKVLYLAAPEAAWQVSLPSASRYFFAIPVQRVLAGQTSLAQSRAYQQHLADIQAYKGPAIVWDTEWFDLKQDAVLHASILRSYTHAAQFGRYDVLLRKPLMP